MEMTAEARAKIEAGMAESRAAWEAKSTTEKLIFLRSMRSDLIRQVRRSVHTSRSRGCDKEIARIDRQIAEIEAAL